MSAIDLPRLPRLAVQVIVATTSVLAFVLSGLALGTPVSAPSPASVILGAVLITAVAPVVRDRSLSLAERRWAGLVPAEVISIGAASHGPDGPDRLEQLAEALHAYTGWASLELTTEVGHVLVGRPAHDRYSVDLEHAGRSVGMLTVTGLGGVSGSCRGAVDRFATSVAAAVANVVGIMLLEQRREELETVVARVQARRRELVRAEAGERARVAAGVLADVAPVLEDLRAAATGGEHDDAAEHCVRLIELLRGHSARVREV